MQHLKLTVSYFGEKFVGWQVQPNGLSIQECLERAWKKITQEQIRITASGRTDSGVHAYAQICHLKTETQIEFEVLRRAINAHTPEEIEVLLIEKTTPDFHAIRSAIEKTYRYQINWGHPRDVFQIGRSWYIPQRLNVPGMIEAAKLFEGEHDFISFAAANGQAATSIRTIKKIECRSLRPTTVPKPPHRGHCRRLSLQYGQNDRGNAGPCRISQPSAHLGSRGHRGERPSFGRNDRTRLWAVSAECCV